MQSFDLTDFVETQRAGLRDALALRLAFYRPRTGVVPTAVLQVSIAIGLMQIQQWTLTQALAGTAIATAGGIALAVIGGGVFARRGFRKCGGSFLRLLVRVEDERFWSDPPLAYLCLGPRWHQLLGAPASEEAEGVTPLDRDLSVKVWGPLSTIVGVRGANGAWLPAKQVKHT